MAKPRKKPVLIRGKLHWYCLTCRRLHPTNDFTVFQGVPLARCRKSIAAYNREKQKSYSKKLKPSPKIITAHEGVYDKIVSELGL